VFRDGIEALPAEEGFGSMAPVIREFLILMDFSLVQPSLVAELISAQATAPPI
jgi:hypothetical protein